MEKFIHTTCVCFHALYVLIVCVYYISMLRYMRAPQHIQQPHTKTVGVRFGLYSKVSLRVSYMRKKCIFHKFNRTLDGFVYNSEIYL